MRLETQIHTHLQGDKKLVDQLAWLGHSHALGAALFGQAPICIRTLLMKEVIGVAYTSTLVG